MAKAGMALRRGGNHVNTESGVGCGGAGADDVQRSIELLDRVLSEFDDVENANQVQNFQQLSASTSTPALRTGGPVLDAESPSLGHQSEDDGYMSMNGRKAKFSSGFKPVIEMESGFVRPGGPDDFPPPPEEAQRLIASLLPKVSPGHRPSKPSQNGGHRRQQPSKRSTPLTQLPPRLDTIPPPQRFQNNPTPNGLADPAVHMVVTTQTTLPKTRHQRPYGWESGGGGGAPFVLDAPPPPPGYRYGSLPIQHPLTSPTRVPPRTVAAAGERHREVRRRGSEDNLSSDLDEPPPPCATPLRPLSELADDERFSDDSLEEGLPPPPPPVAGKRASIAWEVPLDDDEALLTPGSTKVIGRRRRKSGSYSSTSSIPNRLKDLDDWPEPPPCTTEDEVTSPFSDSDDHVTLPPELSHTHISGNDTYVVRKKNRKSVMASSLTSNSSLNSRLSSELSIPASRLSTERDINSRLSREDLTSRLNTPNSRYSVDLSTPHSRLSQELNSPKSRYSLDLNNSRHLSQELSSSPSRLSVDLSSSRSSTPSKRLEKQSKTFDNIKSLIREGVIRNLEDPNEETTEELHCGSSPIVRVLSLPSLNAEDFAPRRELDVTVEEEEESSQHSSEISPLRKIEQNITELLERRDIEVVQDGECLLNGVENLNNSKEKQKKKKAPSKNPKEEDKNKAYDLQKSNSHNEIQKSEDYYRQLLIEGHAFPKKRSGIQKSESAKEMLIAHRGAAAASDASCSPRLQTSASVDFPATAPPPPADFPPLPPSPVDEGQEDDYQEVGRAAAARAGDRQPPAVPPHRGENLKTRSMDGGYSKGRRTNFYNASNRNIPPERRTLPTELQDSKRRPFQKRSSHSPQEERHLQTSCSLPETPIFARGCDIPRTPHRRAPDIPGNQTAPRQSNTIGSLNTIGNMSTGGYRRQMSHSGLDQAVVGADLLRLAGGPGRGWYPKQRHRRPASIEHLDRVSVRAAAHWDQSGRKPLTLPPNLTPRFFQRGPRDALRRVTSLLIRKGNNGKESKKDREIVSPTIHENANGEEVHKKKGFFKSFWKKTRHYSLEQQ